MARNYMPRHNPYQVSASKDRNSPLRTWKQLGTVWQPSHRSAAILNGSPDVDVAGGVVQEIDSYVGVIFEFPSGWFVRVTL